MVSIIIPVYNNLKLTIECINSLLNHLDDSVEYEIIISDDASTDETYEFFKQLNHKKIKYTRNKKNMGFAYTCNRGAEVASGEYLLFLNNDCIVIDNFLPKFIQTFKDFPNTGIVGAKLLYQDKTIQHAGVVIFPTFSIDHIFKNFPFDYYAVNRIRKLKIVTGACLMIPKKIFFENDKFDENFENGFEDVDLCLKVFYKEKNIIYNPEICLFHLENKTRKSHSQKPSEIRNSKYLYDKWRDKITPDYFLLNEGFDFKLNEVGDVYIIKKFSKKIHIPEKEEELLQIIAKEPLIFLAFKKLINYYIENNKLDNAIYYCKELIKFEPVLDNFRLLAYLYKIKNDLNSYKNIQNVISQLRQLGDFNQEKIRYKLEYLIKKRKLREAYYLVQWYIDYGFGINEKKLIRDFYEEYNKNFYKYKKPYLTKKIKSEIKNFKYTPLISIIMPVYNVDLKWLKLAINSVKKQWYKNWELCIVDDCSTNLELKKYLKKLKNPKIKIRFLEQNLGIAGASNEALKMAEGEYIGLLDNDDELTIDAFYEVVKVLNRENYDLIYSDEDKVDIYGEYNSPNFKPNYSYDMFLSQNYINHFCVVKKDLVKKIGGWRKGFEGSQDYDLFLRVIEKTDKIFHIPKVLYHWRQIPGSTAYEFSGKSYAQETGKKALEDFFKRKKIDAIVENGKFPGTYKVTYSLNKEPLVSIIIPFKDQCELLERCLTSIIEKTTYQNYEILCINNSSKLQKTYDIIKKFQNLNKQINKIYFYDYNKPFNFSEINNYAIKKFSKGEHIILLNSDIEIITPNWIENLLMFSQRDNVGAVGCLLYYPDDTIQHAGIILGIGGVAGHSHKYFKRNDHGYFCRIYLTQNISAVTGAMMMFKKKIFFEVNGFDEKNLKISFNDVDFCLKLREKGYLNVYTPWVEAYHYESKTRGYEDTREKKERFKKEFSFMKKKWGRILKEDPYYNPNLTLEKEDFSLRL